VPIAAHSPAGFRVSSIAEIIHPPKPGVADRDARRGLRADRAATSGNGVPLRLPPCGALRHWIRAEHDASPRGTHCPPLRLPHAVRYVNGYVRSTTPRHAAHTVRRYVCNIVRRYAVGYVPSNLAQ